MNEGYIPESAGALRLEHLREEFYRMLRRSALRRVETKGKGKEGRRMVTGRGRVVKAGTAVP